MTPTRSLRVTGLMALQLVRDGAVGGGGAAAAGSCAHTVSDLE